MDVAQAAIALQYIVSGALLCFMLHCFLAKNGIPTLEFLRDIWYMVQLPFLIAASELAFLLNPRATQRRAGFVVNVKCIIRCILILVVRKMVGPSWIFSKLLVALTTSLADPTPVPITPNFACIAKEMRGVTRLPDGTVKRCSVRVLLCITTERYADGRIVATQRITSDHPAYQRDPEFLLDGNVEPAPLPVSDAEPVMPMC